MQVTTCGTAPSRTKIATVIAAYLLQPLCTDRRMSGCQPVRVRACHAGMGADVQRGANVKISQYMPNTSRAREEAGHHLATRVDPWLSRGSPLGGWGSVDRPPKLCHPYKLFPARDLGRKIAPEGEEGWGSVTCCDATQAPPRHEPSPAWRIFDPSTGACARTRRPAPGPLPMDAHPQLPGRGHDDSNFERAATCDRPAAPNRHGLTPGLQGVFGALLGSYHPVITPLTPHYRRVFRPPVPRPAAAPLRTWTLNVERWSRVSVVRRAAAGTMRICNFSMEPCR